MKSAPTERFDYLIIGAGVIGLAIARELIGRHPKKRIAVIDKENDVAHHASGRNSGVLHAGFYYTSDSLKAKFTADGNREMRAYCEMNGIPINDCGKVVVAGNEAERLALFELEKRGKKNGSEVEIIDEKRLAEIEPNARTFKNALYSPKTGTVDPVEVCGAIRRELVAKGVSFFFRTAYTRKVTDHVIEAGGKHFEAEKIINCGGLYADRIAKEFGFSQKYSIVPFKGIYLKYTDKDSPVRTCIYPVPNLKNPFLGVHFTITSSNQIKIGPTAIPAFWRENYSGLKNFRFREFVEVLFLELRLFIRNSFDFRTLAFEEMKKYRRSHFVDLARDMVREIEPRGFTEWTKPGIRAQLLNLETMALVQDFVVEGDKNSVHVLNAVSPAFTSSMPFARWVVDNYVE